MQAYTFWKTVTMDQANLLEKLIALLDENGIQYCAIGGQAVNAYVEPLVSLDLDLVVGASEEMVVAVFVEAHAVPRTSKAVARGFSVTSDSAVQRPRDGGR